MKDAIPGVKIVAVEPAESALMSGGQASRHGIQGLADGFIPDLVDLDFIDEIIQVRTDDAVKMAGRLAREEGLFVSIRSEANVLASLELAHKLRRGSNTVTILADTGTRYLSLS